MSDKYRTEKIKKRYNRIAPMFNIMDKMIKDEWRKELLSKVSGEVLEVGVGTGINLPYYSTDTNVTGIDFSPKMLAYAKKAEAKLKNNIRLVEMDVQKLHFPDNHFDSVVTTCVFCSVPDPIVGLNEIRRVLKPNGHLFMLEHMRSNNVLLGKMMDWINPFVVGIVGANINRKTEENLTQAGFNVVAEKQIMGSIMKELKLIKS